jgi:hypothetical protein
MNWLRALLLVLSAVAFAGLVAATAFLLAYEHFAAGTACLLTILAVFVWIARTTVFYD